MSVIVLLLAQPTERGDMTDQTIQPLSTIRPLTTIAPTTDPMPSMRRVRYHLFIRDYTKTVVDDLGEHMTLRYARFIGCQTVRALDGNSGEHHWHVVRTSRPFTYAEVMAL